MFKAETCATVLGESAPLTVERLIRLSGYEEGYWTGVRSGDGAQSARCLLSFLATFELHPETPDGAVQAFLELNEWVQSILDRLPIAFKVKGSGNKKTYPYDYEMRGYVIWVHQIACHYHWDERTILDLPVLRAAHYVQEILLTEHQRREWEHMHSEVAYEYKDGKSRLRKLPKPDWMRPQPKKQPKMKDIPASYLPVGNVMRPDATD